jgi:hypothetical protein
MTGHEKTIQRLSRSTASWLPTAVSFPRRMLSLSIITSSPSASVLGKMTPDEVAVLAGRTNPQDFKTTGSESSEKFSVEQFARGLIATISDTVPMSWKDSRFVHAPSFVVHPMATLATETITALNESTKGDPSSPFRGSRIRLLHGILSGPCLQRMSQGPQAATQNEDFEHSEQAIARLMEMGFTRDLSWDALDFVRSNRVELAAECALAHPVSSPATIERRRTERANRRRQRGPQPQEMETEETQWMRLTPLMLTLWILSMWVFHSQLLEEDSPKYGAIQNVSSRPKARKLSSSVRLDPSASVNGDAENEALSIVLSSFLLDFTSDSLKNRKRSLRVS